MSDPTATIDDQEISNRGVATLEPTDTDWGTDTDTAWETVELSEPTAQGNGEVAAAIPLPLPPSIPLLTRAVSGRYRGNLGGFQLELRVDVDRTRPMKRLSGDFYQVNGGTTTYFGSFVVNSPTVTVTSTQVVVKGLGSFTFSAGAPVVQVTIRRRTLLHPPAPADLQFFTTGGAPGATYTCAFESSFFRTVRIETDRVADVTTPVFNSYNTGSLPSGGPSRSLSVVNAYAEAGIQIIPTAGSSLINISEAGPGAKWSDAELHASMVRHFTLWRDIPDWSVWLLVAQLHDLGSGLLGIMFDQHGKQRQGCAVFHAGVGGTTADKLRLQLYTYVHELGHCFNLLHSWQKSLATPPAPNRPTALSWMNYPWHFPGGPTEFWKKFPFQFDNEEIVHLRHAYRNNIIMGGSNFTVGSGLCREAMEDPISDESGLSFSISAPHSSFALGEPVVLELELKSADSQERRVHSWLHPNCGLVKVLICKPNGTVVDYEPLIDHLVGERTIVVDAHHAVKDSAYIGYGRDGFYFDQPGHYSIRAVYAAMDGSEVASNLLKVRVRYPVSPEDDELAELFMGDDQGTLLFLLGSDSEELRSGNLAFDKVLDEHPDHRMATYVRLVKGINAGRDFKTVAEGTENRVVVRPAKPEQSASLLAAVASSEVLDSESTKMVLSNLATAHNRSGDTLAANEALSKLNAMTG